MTLLGVDHSACGKIWHGPSPRLQSEAETLSRVGGLDPVAAMLFARRGADVQNLEAFQNPKLRDLMPDPLSLKDCDRAAKRILQAIKAQETVAIFGDYDVDGATSAALLAGYLQEFDIEPRIYIPDRLQEGYGPNVPAMEALAQAHQLIICVDCGTLAFEPIKAARDLGADVIVLDHHMGAETLPDAIVVNPNRQDEDNHYGYLSAAAVVFLVLVDINRHLETKKPDLLKGLDLVALSTIADVAPLLGANRAFVRSGLDRMKLKERVGLRKMIERFLSHQEVRPSDVGFVLAPRLNAGGRVGDSHLATRLLMSDDEAEAEAIVDELDTLNEARREIEKDITAQAKAQIEATPRTQHLVYAYGEDWHPGVLGIVASRLKSSFDKPALVFGLVDGIYHGSARSVEGIDLGSAIALLVSEGLAVKGGGHKMAAGLSITPEKLDAAMQRLDGLLKRQYDQLPQAALSIDALIAPARIDLELMDWIDMAGPYGAMAPEPLFALADMKLTARTILKDTHIRYQFRDLGGKTITVMAFHARGGALDLGEDYVGKNAHLAVSLSRNFWNGRESVNIHLEDWARDP